MSSQLTLVVDPHVATSLLDHYERTSVNEPENKKDFPEVRVHRCRGWLIGSVSHTTATVTNFIPDTYNRPATLGKQDSTKRESGKKTDSDLYMEKFVEWTNVTKQVFPTDATLIGFYSVGDGTPVRSLGQDGNGHTILVSKSFESWAQSSLDFKYFQTKGEAFYLDIRVPTKEKLALELNGKHFKFIKRNQDAPPGQRFEESVMNVRVKPETAAANTIMNHVISCAYGDSVEDTVVPALDIDRVIGTLQDGETVQDKIAEIVEQLAKATQAKTGPRVKEIQEAVAKFRTERAAAAETGEGYGEVRKKNALMIKYVAALMQEQVQLLDSNIKLNQRARR